MNAEAFYKNRILLILFTAAMALFTSSLANIAFAQTGESKIQPLGPSSYLDYAFTSPTALYADEDVIAVVCEDKTVFFYGGKIYERASVKPDGQLCRSGNRLYYITSSSMRYVELGSFTDTPLSPTVPASSFSIKGDRMITVTTSGTVFYSGMETGTPVKTEGYSFNGPEASYAMAASVYIADDDYYSLVGSIYKKNVKLCEGAASYMTDIDGKLYFSNQEGVFTLENGEAKCIYERTEASAEDGVLGVWGYKGKLLFVDGKKDCLMIMNADGSELRAFMFDVKISTDAKLTFVEEPTTVTVEEGARVHRGEVDGQAFTLTVTEKLEATEELVFIAEVDGYSLLYGKGGYLLTGSSAPLEQNRAISFEKGYILYDCAAYVTCIANSTDELFRLKKGDEVKLLGSCELNGVKFNLIEFEGKKGFVLSGEISRELYGKLPQNADGFLQETDGDRTVIAVIIILLSTAVFATAMLVLLIKKDYIKL